MTFKGTLIGWFHLLTCFGLVVAYWIWGKSSLSVGLIPVWPVIILGLLPLGMVFWPFQISFSGLGLRQPKSARKLWGLYVLILVGSPLVVLIGMKMSGVAHFYGSLFPAGTSVAYKLVALGSFVLVSTATLEFFFRCFFLMGHRKFPVVSASAVAVLVVIAEVIVHLQKPAMEAAGMGLLSALLCFITLRTQSVVPAFLLHLWVEAWFVASFFL